MFAGYHIGLLICLFLSRPVICQRWWLQRMTMPPLFRFVERPTTRVQGRHRVLSSSWGEVVAGTILNLWVLCVFPLFKSRLSRSFFQIFLIFGSLFSDLDVRLCSFVFQRSRRDSNEEWEIQFDEISMGPRIGSGSFGTVYRGQWHGPVAIKQLNVKEPSPAQLEAFKNEVAVLKSVPKQIVLFFCDFWLRVCLIESTNFFLLLHILMKFLLRAVVPPCFLHCLCTISFSNLEL